MINVSNRVLEAYYNLLSGLSIDGTTVPVYRVDAPVDAPNYYVIIRAESIGNRSNNNAFVHSVAVVTDVVTKFGASELIRDDIASRIDSSIGSLLLPTPSTHGLSATGIQITSVRRQDQNFIPEDDGSFRTNRVVTRNINRVKEI